MPLKGFESLYDKNAKQIVSQDKKSQRYHRGNNIESAYVTHYSLQYRIVANKCKTQEIRSTKYRKYQMRWGRKLIQKTGYIEETI